MSDRLTGSCLCGAIKFEINGQIKAAANCHCKTCKKITGGAFETVAVVAEKDFEIIAGQDVLASYKISENATKNFCRTCGTPIFNAIAKYPGNCMVQVGSLDEPALVTPAINIFCESMLPWVNGIAELQCFEREPVRQEG